MKVLTNIKNTTTALATVLVRIPLGAVGEHWSPVGCNHETGLIRQPIGLSVANDASFVLHVSRVLMIRCRKCSIETAINPSTYPEYLLRHLNFLDVNYFHHMKGKN